MTLTTPSLDAAPRPLLAALWMGGAITFFSTMAVAGRQARFGHDAFEVMLYRSLVGVLIVVTILLLTGRTREVRTAKFGTHVLRNVSHFSGQCLWFFAVAGIPLAQLFALEFTSPLWVTLLAPLLLAETLTRRRVICACIGVVGVLMVARPSPSTISPELVAAAISSLGFALSAIFTKKLTRTDSTMCILFWLTLMQLTFGVVTSGFDGHIALPTDETLPWLVLVGICGLSAHFCLTRALGVAPAGIVMQIDFLRLPVIAVVGMLIYDEPIQLMVFLGGAVILTANVMNVRGGRSPAPVK